MIDRKPPGADIPKWTDLMSDPGANPRVQSVQFSNLR
jgi:hypothetical protein